MTVLRAINNEFLAGALMLVLGAGAAMEGATYKIGTLAAMGPGFFPVALGVMLAACGVAILVRAGIARSPARQPGARPEWRGWACISLGLVAFIVIGKYGGLVPATFALVFVAALGDRENNVINAALLALAIVAVSVVVFWWLLRVQFPLFSWG